MVIVGRRRIAELEHELTYLRREVDAAQLAACDARRQVEKADAEVTYWRTRCERLLDAALAKRGEVTAPTMVDVQPRGALSTLFAGPLAGLGITSIPGHPGPLVHPSLPGQAMNTTGNEPAH